MAQRKIMLVEGAKKPGPDKPGEIWKPVPEFVGYEASDQGRIRSVDRKVRLRNRWGNFEWRLYKGRILSPGLTSAGYPHVQIGKGNGDYSGADVHALVMKAFVGPPPSSDHEVGHRDGNRNNACLNNLRYVTYAEQHEDQRKHGTKQQGIRHYAAKLTDEKVLEILGSSDNYGILAKRYGVSRTVISSIKNRFSWRHIKWPP